MFRLPSNLISNFLNLIILPTICFNFILKEFTIVRHPVQNTLKFISMINKSLLKISKIIVSFICRMIHGIVRYNKIIKHQLNIREKNTNRVENYVMIPKLSQLRLNLDFNRYLSLIIYLPKTGVIMLIIFLIFYKIKSHPPLKGREVIKISIFKIIL